jgi:hypothetical protein
VTARTLPRAHRARGRCGVGSRARIYIYNYEIHSAREDDATQTVLNIKRAQGFCPWIPPQEGARGQSSSARHDLPSKGSARALIDLVTRSI